MPMSRKLRWAAWFRRSSDRLAMMPIVFRYFVGEKIGGACYGLMIV